MKYYTCSQCNTTFYSDKLNVKHCGWEAVRLPLRIPQTRIIHEGDTKFCAVCGSGMMKRRWWQSRVCRNGCVVA